jgi:GNAT superfamily N-acetyltransferase
MDPNRHPQHDAVAQTVASWYEAEHPEQGYEVEHRRFGSYRTNRFEPGWGAVTAIDVDDASELLRDVDAFFGDRPVSLQFTRKPAAREQIVAAGWCDEEETVYLAHVGAFPPTPAFHVEPIEPSTIDAFARVRVQSFADSEDEPDPAALDAEITSRRAELRGDGRGLIARVAAQPAAMCAYYAKLDHFVFLLGTRVPFRGRGIASAILGRVVESAHRAGARSVVINARAGGGPEQLYRRLGFSAEVYRQWTYRRRRYA